MQQEPEAGGTQWAGGQGVRAAVAEGRPQRNGPSGLVQSFIFPKTMSHGVRFPSGN